MFFCSSYTCSFLVLKYEFKQTFRFLEILCKYFVIIIVVVVIVRFVVGVLLLSNIFGVLLYFEITLFNVSAYKVGSCEVRSLILLLFCFVYQRMFDNISGSHHPFSNQSSLKFFSTLCFRSMSY